MFQKKRIMGIRNQKVAKIIQQHEIESEMLKPKILKCSNCGFTTRSIFKFHEHYENDTTGLCDDVHY